MKKIKKLMNKNNELEEELKFTRDGYEEEIAVLLEKHEDLKRKLGLLVENHKREPAKEIPSPRGPARLLTPTACFPSSWAKSPW